MGVLDTVVSDAVPRHPKVLLWGKPGLGKTVTALWIARHFGLRILGVDADGGLGVYRNSTEGDGDPTWPPMDTLEVTDPIAVTQGIEELLRDPRKWGMFVVDPISMLTKTAEVETDQAARRKKNAKMSTQIGDYETAMSMGDRQNLNRISFLLVRDLWRLKMPVVVTAREKNEWKDQKVIGVVPAAPEGFDHEFDVVVRLVKTVEGGDTFCHVQKDRLRRLPNLIEMPANNPFVLAQTLATVYSDLWTLGTASNPRASDEQIQRIYELQAQLGVTGKQMALVLAREFKANELADLRPEQADALVARMAARAAAATQPQTQPTETPTPTNAT